MYHDQWKTWLVVRKDKPLKLKNFPHLFKFSESIKRLSEKHQIPYVFAEAYIAMYFDYTLIYRGGSPNYKLFKMTPHGDYVTRWPMYHLWKDHPIDDGIIERFLAMPNNRYMQPNTVIETPESYDLYLMQMNITKFKVTNHINPNWDFEKDAPKDDVVCRMVLKYVKENKIYTLFKAHPTTSMPSEKAWEVYKRDGLVSEYSIFIDNVNTDSLIPNANRIYSADSAVSLNAMLAGKKVATFHPMDLSEIIPMIKSPEELDLIQPVPIEDQKRFLSWYYHKLVIDIDDPNYEDKMESIMIRFKNGERTKELFGC
jgi:hypothetical protein